jgi:hypothetical protein
MVCVLCKCSASFSLSWVVFPTLLSFGALTVRNGEWILDIAPCVSKSLLFPFSFKTRLLYLLLKSLLLAIYAGKRTVYGEITGKDLLYKK